MKELLVYACISFWGMHGLFAQTSELDHYIARALESNIALQKKELSLEKSLVALEEAKAMFFPTLSVEARYSMAAGGRMINFPVGDLLNGVYSNLNLINARNSNTIPDYPSFPQYPMLRNEEIDFLRDKEHETKLRLVFPVFNSAIIYNHRIKKELAEVERISVDLYKRELVREVKAGYFNYLKASEGVSLFENTMKLVEENYRTSQSLYQNHKATVDVVFAAEAQVKKVEAELAIAKRDEHTAKAYFNFLLNRNYDAEIRKSTLAPSPAEVLTLSQAREGAFQKREELVQLTQYLKVSEENIALNKAGFLPQINLVADYGFQGERYSFSGKDDFSMGTLALSWNLFNRPTKIKVQQAAIERRILEEQKREVKEQIGLQVVQAYYDLEAAGKSIQLAQKEMDSTQKAYRLVNKKFTQGQANVVELTGARTNLTNAGHKLIIARFDYQVKLAELERATGSYQW